VGERGRGCWNGWGGGEGGVRAKKVYMGAEDEVSIAWRPSSHSSYLPGVCVCVCVCVSVFLSG